MEDIKYDKLSTQEYLKSDSDLTNNDKYLLIKLRTRMAELKVNFKGKYEDLICPLCNNDNDTQSHLFNCDVLLKECKELAENYEIEYEDIFSSKDKQIKAVKLLIKMCQIR